jgi:hypothetical protein
MCKLSLKLTCWDVCEKQKRGSYITHLNTKRKLQKATTFRTRLTSHYLSPLHITPSLSMRRSRKPLNHHQHSRCSVATSRHAIPRPSGLRIDFDALLACSSSSESSWDAMKWRPNHVFLLFLQACCRPQRPPRHSSPTREAPRWVLAPPRLFPSSPLTL